MSCSCQGVFRQWALSYNSNMIELRLHIETPTRTRTRNAILEAALAVLTENAGASLGDVADAAKVARSTLHRYFPERTNLVAALNQFAEEQIAAATKRARSTRARLPTRSSA